MVSDIDFEFIVADPNGKEIGIIDDSPNIDVENGDENDFQFEIHSETYDKNKYWYGHRIYVPDTEYGGLLEELSVDEYTSKVTWNGYTWRGLLEEKVVEPPTGEAYLYLSGELNEVIGKLLGNKFGDLYRASESLTGITVSNHKVSRYITLYEAITNLLDAYEYKLKIAYKQGEGTEQGYVELSAVPIVDYSEELEYSEESNCKLSINDYRRGINHLICLGGGELTERIVIHLYVQSDGSIGDTRYYTEKNERVAIYEYSNADDEEILREYGIDKLKELQNYKKVGISIDNMDLDIGDIVAGYESITDTQIKKPIIKKILRIISGVPEIEYEVKGDD